MKRSRKGQITLELLAGMSFLLFIFLIFSFLAYQKTTQSKELEAYLHAQRICRNFVKNINTISEQGNSYFKYFTLPENIYGNYPYTLTTYGNRVEISWESNRSPYSLPIETKNLTIYCLDKGKEKKNKILNDHGKIIITCYRADLKPLEETFQPKEVVTGEIVNLSIKIKNFGVLASGNFTVSFNNQDFNLSLGVEERKEIKTEYQAPLIPGEYLIPVEVDPDNEVEESIEEDNNLNLTITVK